MGVDLAWAAPVEFSVRPQHLIVTVFGRYGRARGGTMQVADLLELMAALGVDAGTVRSSVSRLKQRGLLVSDRTGGAAAYRLSDSLSDVFDAGDHRIFEVHRAAPGDPWLLASFSVPEKERPLRHQLRKLLTRLGFGQVSGGLWVAPGLIADETKAALHQAGLDDYVELFLGARVSSEPLTDAVRGWWDFAALEPLYRAFVDAYGHVLGAELNTEQAFRVYVAVVTHWRRLTYLDPGIPPDVLPEGWAGLKAERLFFDLHAQLEPLAERFVASVMD
ncbi:MAG: PaaX family transcriptional regulator C-terminal domain-containing protein [Microbacterium sp.]